MQSRDIDSTALRGGGFLALPDGAGPFPGVVVIHEAYGLTDNIREIAQRFAVTEETIKHHLTRIFDKVGAANRVELALVAARHGFVH